MALNVNNLITNILPALHSDSLANLVWWSDAELTRFFDECMKSLGRRFGVFVLRSDAPITLATGTATYAAPSRHLATLHVSHKASSSSYTPLIASSTTELEGLDDDFRTTQGDAPAYWYSDRQGFNTIGIKPVPNVTANGTWLELIYSEFPAELDEAHVNTTIPVPQPIGDYLELYTISKAYAKESDAALPEVAQSTLELAKLYEQIILGLWGDSQ